MNCYIIPTFYGCLTRHSFHGGGAGEYRAPRLDHRVVDEQHRDLKCADKIKTNPQGKFI